jgi:hypothetical protein
VGMILNMGLNLSRKYDHTSVCPMFLSL